MARIPVYEEQSQFQPVSFDAPVAQIRPMDFSRVQQAIGQWQQRASQKLEEKAMQHQREQGMLAQDPLESTEVAQPDEKIAERFQQSFREGAEELWQNQFSADIQKTRGRLAREHRHDPEGFRRAATEYAKATEETLKKSNSVLAVQARQAIEQEMEGTALQLEENVFAQQQARQSAELVRSVDEFTNISDDEQRTMPDEERFYKSISQVESMVDDLVDRNKLEPSTAERLKSQKREQLTRSYVEGAFSEAINNEDADGAQEIVESLYRGAWFENNEQGRVTADRLARRLEQTFSSEGVSNSQLVSLGLNRLDRMVKAAEDGLPVDFDEAESLAEQTLSFKPTPLQEEQIALKLNGLHFASQVVPEIENAPLSGLLSYQEALDQDHEALDSSTRRTVTDKVKKEIKRVEGALRDNDLAALGGTLDIYRAGPDEVARRRKRAANRINMPVDQVPLWSNAELRQFNQDYQRAVEAGDFDVMDQLTTMYMGPVHDNPLAMASAARRLVDAGGPMAVAARLAMAGEALNVRDLQYQFVIGESLDKGKLAQETGIDIADLTGDGAITEALRSISLDDAEMYQDTLNFFFNTYAADVQNNIEQKGMRTGKARKEAKNNLQRQLFPFTENVEFNNGSILPQQIVQTEATVDKVNEYLNNPEDNFGIQSGVDTTYIKPMPLDDGNIGFYHESMGRFLTNKEGTEIVRVPIQETIEEEEETRDVSQYGEEIEARGEQHTLFSAEDVISGLRKAYDFASQKVKESRERNINYRLFESAKQYGLNERFFKDLVSGIKRTPDEDKGGSRYAPTQEALRADAQKEVRWKKVKQKFPSTQGRLSEPTWDISNPAVRPYAVADLFDQYKNKFNGDEKAMLAAYWEGPDLVTSLQKEHGEDWYDQLPVKTRQFIRRVRRDRR